MVQVRMGEQNVLEPAKTEPAGHQLALSAFAAVDHESIFING